MLDDQNVIKQRDPSGALNEIYSLPEQMRFEPTVIGQPSGEITNVVLAGMGGSALAADVIKALIVNELTVPLEVVKGYDLPAYVGQNTLVIAISHSGNTEETLSCYDQARERGSIMAAMATGGRLFERAERDNVVRSQIPVGVQPRMLVVYHIRILLSLLQQYNVIDDRLYREIGGSADWMSDQLKQWAADVPVEHNYAKQIATDAAGKTAVFYGGQLTWTLAYKWKISWNESAKNLAFWNQYPEFNHNEFMGWVSHPIEKPYAVFDLISSFERPRIRERMELSDRLLSGKRPKARTIEFLGKTPVQQLIWGMALADMSSIYLAILNNVDPTPVELIERFKKELS